MTNGGSLLKRGRSFDPECGRTTHRLRIGSSILSNLGVVAEWPEHEETCIMHPSQSFNRCFGFSYSCQCSRGDDPRPTWPEWASDEMFDLAYKLACELQDKRGSHHRAAASAAKLEREAVA